MAFNSLIRGPFHGVSSVIREFTLGGTTAVMDIVNVESGKALPASAGDAVAGIALEAGTTNTTGVAVNVTPKLIIVMDNDNIGTTFAATHVYARFDIIGSTGAQLVDTSTLDQTYGGPNGQLLCLTFNPTVVGITGTSLGEFMVAETQGA